MAGGFESDAFPILFLRVKLFSNILSFVIESYI